MKGSLVRIGLGAALTFALSSLQPALADAIDGDWCSGNGKHLSIAGPTIVTPGGNRLEGAYSRHSFTYTAPAGESDGGQEVRMRLLNETTVQIHSGHMDQGQVLIWHRYSPTTS